MFNKIKDVIKRQNDKQKNVKETVSRKYSDVNPKIKSGKDKEKATKKLIVGTKLKNK